MREKRIFKEQKVVKIGIKKSFLGRQGSQKRRQAQEVQKRSFRERKRSKQGIFCQDCMS